MMRSHFSTSPSLNRWSERSRAVTPQLIALLGVVALALAGCTSVGKVVQPYTNKDGLTVVEGHPADTLGYRLYLPADATPANPPKVVVWLHAAHDEGTGLIEPLAPLFAKHGYALMVPLKENYGSWSGAEINLLFTKTFTAMKAEQPVNVNGPLLFGFSGGGQMALHLWSTAPDAMGGMILVGATPALVDDDQEHPIVLLAKERVEHTAILALTGEEERATSEWEKIQQAWINAGVPLTFGAVKGKGQQWLMGENQISLLDQWLTVVSGSPAAAGT